MLSSTSKLNKENFTFPQRDKKQVSIKKEQPTTIKRD